MLKVLEERSLNPLWADLEIIPIASERSLGKTIIFKGKEIKIIGIEAALESKAQIVLLSAGAEVSRAWAQKFAEKGMYVIDNSSAWRRDADVPLLVPEINSECIKKDSYLIANPNCSTIQVVAALAPLHKEFCIDRMVISTYQSVTGSGLAGLQQLMDERSGIEGKKAYPHAIDLNLIPQGGSFLEDGGTTEEDKLLFETRKILGAAELRITSTVVRVPVKGGHSAAINVTFKKPFELEKVFALLRSTPGLLVMDEPLQSIYPTPLIAEDRDEVFIGRIRRDVSAENALNLWVVADNLRKGAATNAVQIAEYLIEQGYLTG